MASTANEEIGQDEIAGNGYQEIRYHSIGSVSGSRLRIGRDQQLLMDIAEKDQFDHWTD